MLRIVLGTLLSLSALLALPTAAHARLQCVTYARSVSDVQISGNARDWWGNAAGVYARGQEPSEGAVLAFRGTAAMPYGHVAVVKEVKDNGTYVEEGYNGNPPPDDHNYYTRTVSNTVPSAFLYLPTQEEKK